MSIELNAADRTAVGTRQAKRLRADGRVPASLQGLGKPHRDIHIDGDEFFAARRAHQTLFDLQLPGGAEAALVRELQWDAFGDQLLHVEFRRVLRGVAIEAEVDLHFVGQARLGVLTPLHNRITIRAIPSKIPEFIEVPAALVGEHPLLAKDLPLPEGVALADDPELHIAIAAAASSVEDTLETEAPAVEPGAEAAPAAAP
ncbi:MAG TPA: 50S ribosomal protein L25, partial [Planctomycetota bacterium]|nr:50S ribosomal protein L25 [Planctomycetota bacterium]